MTTDATPRPAGLRAVIFDMDGVVTRTADLHAAAWKETFDHYLEERRRRGEPGFEPFELEADYLRCVDGKPRLDGARAFLSSRGLVLPEGSAGDGPELETVHGLGARKDRLFARRLRASGAAAYETTVTLIEELRARGVRTGLITSSRHGREVLAAAGVAALFDVIVDGVDAARLELPGKPQPDIFLAAARRLGVQPDAAAVVEDASAGVEAGRRGGFGLVVGVDRGGNRRALLTRGADLVVGDLAEVDPARLAARLRRRGRGTPRRAAAWCVDQEGFDPAREHEVESLFTIGNGYMGVRGALDAPLPTSRADLFVAGVFDRKAATLPYSEMELLVEGGGRDLHGEIAPLPSPLRVAIAVGGHRLEVAQGGWREHLRRLDLLHFELRSRVLAGAESGPRVEVQSWRLASLADLHLLLQQVKVTCDDPAAVIELNAAPEAPEWERDHPHLVRRSAAAPPGIDLRVYATRASGLTVALASRLRLEGRSGFADRGVEGVVRLQRAISVFTSRDDPDPVRAAVEHAAAWRWRDFARARRAHRAAAHAFWQRADLRCLGSPATTQALRFNAYHLRIAADHDPGVSVGARTLSGRAYGGHVFWDVEIFMLPFYVHTCPDIARTLLTYRHRTLAGARQRARGLGYRGACYAWESTVTGADTTPTSILLRTSGTMVPIYTGREELHVAADVAFAVWRYWTATHDDAFLRDFGVEILVETARFWASRMERAQDGYHLRGVTGPDEYHHTVDDDAFTNWMARCNLRRAVWAVGWLAEKHPQPWERLAAALDLHPDEPRAWREQARTLFIPRPNAAGVIEQFAGYFGLRDERPAPAERLRPPIGRLLDAEAVNGSQLIKQADVLMIPFLFPEAFSPRVLAANYDYYEPRTDHGSSLSPPVHAALAARLGRQQDARRYWRESLWLDLANAMANSGLGVHPACMGGAWQALVFGFLGVRLGARGPLVARDAGARLLEEWGSVRLRLAFRGRLHELGAAPGAAAPRAPGAQEGRDAAGH